MCLGSGSPTFLSAEVRDHHHWSGGQYGILFPEFYCGFPGHIDHGRTSGLEYYFGDTILNTCHDGFTLRGESVQTCLGNGSWSGERPKCVEVTCDAGEDLEHGSVSRVSPARGVVGTELRVGEVIQFSCDEGFTLDGASRLSCLEDGSLSDSQPICQPVPCSLPPM